MGINLPPDASTYRQVPSRPGGSTWKYSPRSARHDPQDVVLVIHGPERRELYNVHASRTNLFAADYVLSGRVTVSSSPRRWAALPDGVSCARRSSTVRCSAGCRLTACWSRCTTSPTGRRRALPDLHLQPAVRRRWRPTTGSSSPCTCAASRPTTWRRALRPRALSLAVELRGTDSDNGESPCRSPQDARPRTRHCPPRCARGAVRRRGARRRGRQGGRAGLAPVVPRPVDETCPPGRTSRVSTAIYRMNLMQPAPNECVSPDPATGNGLYDARAGDRVVRGGHGRPRRRSDLLGARLPIRSAFVVQLERPGTHREVDRRERPGRRRVPVACAVSAALGALSFPGTSPSSARTPSLSRTPFA